MGLAYLLILFGGPLVILEELFYRAFEVLTLPLVLVENAFYKAGEAFNK